MSMIRINVGHSNCLIKVELTRVQDHGFVSLFFETSNQHLTHNKVVILHSY